MLKKYKLKTHKGAQKRFAVTGSGKIMRMKGLKSHLRRHKANRVLRVFDKKLVLDHADVKRIERLIPYA